MKPAIHLSRMPGIKVWLCYAGQLWDSRTAVGFGLTPAECYGDWLSMPKHPDCCWMKAGAQ